MFILHERFGSVKTLYLMDWQGTLNQTQDPVAEVRRLQAAGHYVVLHSNSSSNPGINSTARACNDVWSKMMLAHEMIELIRATMTENGLDNVVMVDDDRGSALPALMNFHGISMFQITIDQLEGTILL